MSARLPNAQDRYAPPHHPLPQRRRAHCHAAANHHPHLRHRSERHPLHELSRVPPLGRHRARHR
eukprot:scaffold145174_cov166-Phaeocystis_antarctica.AAC.1